MKLTYSWLKDFVEIRIPAKQLADKLTMAGLEVVSLDKKDGDYVFEIEITSNRPDWLSVVGIAREVVAITNSKLKTQNQNSKPKLKTKTQNLEKGNLEIDIENKKDCPLYTAKIIRDVKVGPSPKWLKERLELIGCRSINNVVDITNYILFTYGEPLHAFDLDKLFSRQPNIVIRRAKEKEKTITLDGADRALDKDILVIASEEKPVAIAGIMGGKDTEVTEGTKNILLEAAIFDPIVIRRARQKLGMQTDSSYRFERGIDCQTAQFASLEAVRLIQEFAFGELVLAKNAGLTKVKNKTINLDGLRINQFLGIDVPGNRIKDILSNLGFRVRPKTKNNYSIDVPSYRQDVNLEVDLIEEIGRIYGYDAIPKSLPAIKPRLNINKTRDLVSLIKNILVGLGLNEVITYSLIDRDLLKDSESGHISGIIEILNPLSREQEILRPTIIPSLLKCIAYNLNQKQDYVNIFEVAKNFLGSSREFQEELILGIALCGAKSFFVSGQGMVKEEAGILHLKGILEVLFGRLGIKDYSFDQAQITSGIIVEVDKEKIGVFRQAKRGELDRFDIKNKDVVIAEISLDKFLSYINLEKKFVPLPRYPGITRDMSFILREEIKIEEIIRVIQDKGGVLLRQVRVIDFYKGKQIPLGFKGLTLSCLYRLDERTLTEAEVNPAHSLISTALVKEFNVQLRS